MKWRSEANETLEEESSIEKCEAELVKREMRSVGEVVMR
jgi:hypothetical protein